MKRLTGEQIKLLHKMLIEETGGCDGLRDENLFESAINSPFQTFDGIYVYPTIERKAARLGYSLISNHPFVDGNKRAGIMAMLSFLEINEIKIDCEDDDLIHIGLRIAAGTMNDEELLSWLLDHEI
ncbi:MULTISPECIES: type II toxin-antitoxin system death-on-curing family toxin [Christensenella]|jgi:death on curing protein|uniref:Death on curing protein, Doc toxin n=2 Tax=Christensenella TaxID=990721 RepID=A0A0M2NNX0_9FIRM|nr:MULTISPECIES: type II toxin-antitoxin system death-on-curing family toxin [Christensenella]KKI51910.1 Death on curing protein, Doc toxin [Christensenella hongkongensis]MBC5648743.1 type II toxin-antitoxin system death-on-curing family toxin [Christensenella tenuis]TCW24510.1 death-on-curing protein [Christensenella hongkongensis]